MKISSCKTLLVALMSTLMFGCGDEPQVNSNNDNKTPEPNEPAPVVGLDKQPLVAEAPLSRSGDQILGNPDYQAISYGAWRSSVRQDGELVPTIEQHIEDMKILAAMGVKVIRTYNTQGYTGLDGRTNTENLLEAIKLLIAEDNSFEMYVMLGI